MIDSVIAVLAAASSFNTSHAFLLAISIYAACPTHITLVSLFDQENQALHRSLLLKLFQVFDHA